MQVKSVLAKGLRSLAASVRKRNYILRRSKKSGGGAKSRQGRGERCLKLLIYVHGDRKNIKNMDFTFRFTFIGKFKNRSQESNF